MNRQIFVFLPCELASQYEAQLLCFGFHSSQLLIPSHCKPSLRLFVVGLRILRISDIDTALMSVEFLWQLLQLVSMEAKEYSSVRRLQPLWLMSICWCSTSPPVPIHLPTQRSSSQGGMMCFGTIAYQQLEMLILMDVRHDAFSSHTMSSPGALV